MASPFGDESDWLELGLGLSTNSCRTRNKEDEKLACGPPQHLQGYDDEEVGLDLKLEIGAAAAGLGSRNKKDRNMRAPLMHQKKQAWPLQMNSDNHGCLKMPLPMDQSHCLSFPNSGLWFALRSSANGKGEAALPQIPKAYIRVKDENMTVFMVKKYLVTKLGLSNEAEVEIWCMGQRLLQTQSLKQVRDGVWLPKLVEFVNSNSLPSFHCSHHHQTPSSSSSTTTTTTYLMSLHYGRTCLF